MTLEELLLGCGPPHVGPASTLIIQYSILVLILFNVLLLRVLHVDHTREGTVLQDDSTVVPTSSRLEPA